MSTVVCCTTCLPRTGDRRPRLRGRAGLTWRRARFRAVFHAAVVAVFANETGESALLAEVVRSLGWLL